ncbi:MAG: 3-oxoacyl-ACP reductase FabG [Thiohalospira sp.]
MRRALVTGGSGDIGSAICHRLGADGFHVIVHGSSRPERSEAVAEAIRQAGGSAESVVFDLTDTGATEEAVAGLLEEGPVQVLVNNAGRHDDAPLAGMSRAQWDAAITVSLDGFFNVTQPLLLPMLRTRWGRVINISSVAGVIGNRGQANYAAAKSGIHGATRSLAQEVGSRGVTVNAVAPGVIEGSMTDEAFDADRIRQMVPMQRAGSTEEVAAVVAFLASDEASYVSGQVIGVNGAMA